jgi:hypothetical protein
MACAQLATYILCSPYYYVSYHTYVGRYVGMYVGTLCG